MSGHNETYLIPGFSDKHIKLKCEFPVDIAQHCDIPLDSIEAGRIMYSINTDKWDSHATGVRFLKVGAKAPGANFTKKLALLETSAKQLEALLVEQGIFHSGRFSFDDIVMRDRYLKIPVRLGRTRSLVTDRLAAVKRAKSKSCIHCKSSLKTANLQTIDILRCPACKKDYPFDSATEQKKRESIAKKVAALDKKITELRKALVELSPYVYFIDHSYPDSSAHLYEGHPFYSDYF